MLSTFQHIERLRKFSLQTEENKSVCAAHTRILEAVLRGSEEDLSRALSDQMCIRDRISTNTPLAEKKAGWIDFNTGVIADGEKTIDEAAKDLLDLVIRVASGEQTKAEKHGFREISIFKDGVVL